MAKHIRKSWWLGGVAVVVGAVVAGFVLKPQGMYWDNAAPSTAAQFPGIAEPRKARDVSAEARRDDPASREGSRLSATTLTNAPVKINFQHPSTRTPDGYLADTGGLFGPQSGGLVYGWLNEPATEARERHAHKDVRYDTFIHLTKGPSQLGPHQNPASAPGGSEGADHIWAIEVGNGL